jgi:twitching motility protein PilT
VLSTLHTTDAAETVNRCIDLFPPSQQRRVRLSLAAALRGIIGQRLVRRAGDGGRIAVASNPHDLRVALRNQGLVA